ncbi:MAG TPA: hypothetical protein VGK02_01440 [Candidatus Aquicultor sp.]|jgi:hypothetical protein
MAYITNITHYIDEDGYPVRSGPAGRAGGFFGKIVAAASLNPPGTIVPSALNCRRRPGHKPCRGHLLIARQDDGVIEWQCPLCKDEGSIHSWKDAYWDKGRYSISNLAPEDVVELRVFESELKELTKILVLSSESEAILYGATFIEEDVELCAPFDSFEEFVGEIAFEANHTDNRSREVNLSRICDRIQILLTFYDMVRDL